MTGISSKEVKGTGGEMQRSSREAENVWSGKGPASTLTPVEGIAEEVVGDSSAEKVGTKWSIPDFRLKCRDCLGEALGVR